MNEEQLQYWRDYCDSVGMNPDEVYVEASIAGNKDIAEELLLLFLQGKKKAGSGLVQDYISAGDELPKIGNYWIVLDSKERPRCILKTTKVVTHKFSDVPVEIAMAEGEGDSSLDFWRKAHIEFFSPYLAGLGIENIEQADVVTEFYQIVFKS